LAVQEGPPYRRLGGGGARRRGRGGLHEHDDVWTLTTSETPIPYSPSLEDAFLRDPEAIVASVSERLGISTPR
jgi:acetoin:2,6-dichlorophenolindophenol oxidoreductase subunit beta